MNEVIWKPSAEDGKLGPYLKDGTRAAWAPQRGSQVVFLACQDEEVLLEGNRGGGKSQVLLVSYAMHCDAGFGTAWNGVIFRHTFDALKDLIKESKEFIPLVWPSARYNETDHSWHWPGGEFLLFRPFESPADFTRYQGRQHPFIGWDELSNWPNDICFRKMISCCRSPLPRIPKKIRATTNPYGVGHNWVKDRYRLPLLPGKIAGPLITDAVDVLGEIEPPRRAIHSSLLENKVLLHGDPGYLGRLRSACTSPEEYKAWIDGDWNIVAGGMFDDVWHPEVNVVEPFAIPPSWLLDRSFDWGSSSPFSVGWWAESDGTDLLTPKGWKATVRGDLYRIAEWYGWNGKPNEGLKLLASEISAGIVERERAMGIHGRVRPGPADTQIFEVENGACIATDMQKPVRIDGKMFPGIQWLRAEKSRVTGWEMMRKMMKMARRSKEGPREEPGLFVFSTCPQFLRTVPILPRDPKNMSDIPKKDLEDHIADETRYRIRTIGTRPRQSIHVGMY